MGEGPDEDEILDYAPDASGTFVPVKQDGLVPIYAGNIGEEEVNAVDARELHRELEVGRDFSNWIKYRLTKCNFKQGRDFIVCSPNLASEGRGGQNKKNYWLTMYAAEHIAMVEQNDVGFKVRDYFITARDELRKHIANESPRVLSAAEPMLQQAKIFTAMAEFAATTEKKLAITDEKLAVTDEKVERLKADVYDIQVAREKAARRVEQLDLPEPDGRKMTSRDKCRYIIDRYADSTKQTTGEERQRMWGQAYDRLNLINHLNVYNRKREKGQSHLDTLSDAEVDLLLRHIVYLYSGALKCDSL